MYQILCNTIPVSLQKYTGTYPQTPVPIKTKPHIQTGGVKKKKNLSK
jgi:hypothetical protein